MATTVSKLEVELTLDSAKFEARVRGSKDALAQFTRGIGKADARVKRHEKNVRSLGTSFRHTIVTLGLMRDALRTAWHMSGGLVQGIVDVTAEFERLNILLTGMSKGVTAIEKATDAAEQFNKVISLAKNAPFAVKELTNSWVKFKSVGIDPATGSLNALVDAVSAFGGTGDILHRATIAVQQMAGKGVISMEELRQQMGEAVPQAMVLLARGMNMSVGQMVDAISMGSVVAKPALQKLFAEFDLTFGGASQKLMETYIGSLARLSTVWQLTLKEMGEASGLFEAVKEEVKQLITELDDPAVRRFGIDIAVGMVKGFRIVINAIRESVKWLNEHANMVWKVIGAWGAFKAMSIAKHLLAAGVAVNGLTRALSLLGAVGLAKVVGNGKRAAAAMGMLKLQVGGVGKAVGKLKLLGWVGILLSIGAAMWGWFAASKAVNDEMESGLDLVKKYGEAAEASSIKSAKAEVEAQEQRLVAISKHLALQIALREEKKKSGEDITNIEFNIQFLQGQYQKLLRVVKANEAVIDDAVSGAARRAADSASRRMLNTFRAGMEEARNMARDQDTMLDTQFQKGEITAEERLAGRLVIWERFQEQQKALALAKVKEQLALRFAAVQEMAVAENEDARKNIQIRIDDATAMIVQIAAVARRESIRIQNDIAHIAAPTELLTNAQKAMVAFGASLDRLLINSKAKVAALSAELLDQPSKLASFISKINNGLFGDITKMKDPMLNAIGQIAVELAKIDKLAEEIKAKNAFEAAMKQATKTLAAATEEAEIFGEAVDNGLNEVPNGRIRRFRRMMAGVAASLKMSTEQAKEFNEITEQLLQTAADTNANERILKTREELNDLNVDAIQNARERFAAEQVLFDQQWKTFLLENAQADNIGELTEQYELLRVAKAKAFEDTTPMKRLLRDWEDTRGKLEASYASWMDAFVNTIVDGVAQGKIEFKKLAIQILADLAKILLKALMVRAVMAMWSGGDQTGQEFMDSGAFRFANGGIMTANGDTPLKKYARGGIATKPQVAIFGEGDQNEAYVPLPDGRSIPVSMSSGSGGTPDVTVNVINESGTPVEAEQSGGVSFDGEGFVLDVVLKAASRAGNFRDGLKGAVKN